MGLSLSRVLCALLAVALVAPGPAAPAPTVDDALDAIAAFAPRAMREQGTPGLSIAITDRNATLRIITLGYANRDAQTPVTAQTRFAIGSITKSMTALALLQLHDGRVEVEPPFVVQLEQRQRSHRFCNRADGKPRLRDNRRLRVAIRIA